MIPLTISLITLLSMKTVLEDSYFLGKRKLITKTPVMNSRANTVKSFWHLTTNCRYFL